MNTERPKEGKAYTEACISYQLRPLTDKGVTSFQTLKINGINISREFNQFT